MGKYTSGIGQGSFNDMLNLKTEEEVYSYSFPGGCIIHRKFLNKN